MSGRRITREVITEHDALRAKATPGPWVESPRKNGRIVYQMRGGFRGYAAHGAGDNAAYITTLANDDEAMCRRVEELEAALRGLADRLKRYADHMAGTEMHTWAVALADQADAARAALDGERP